MDVSSFLGGNFLTHLDLPAPWLTWTVSQVQQQLVGTDQKICLIFAEFPAKPLACNKTNLARAAELYSTNANAWTGRPLLVYRSTTTFQGTSRLCVRVCGPQQAPPDPICDQQGNAVPYQPQPLQPMALQPAPQTAPVQPPAGAPPSPVVPWETDAATESSPGA